MANAFDIMVFIVTVGMAVLGFREGLVRGVIKLAGFIALIVFMGIFAKRITGLAELVDAVPRHIMAPAMFILILVAGSILIHVVALFLHKLVHMTPAGFVDSGLGCGLGIVKALLLCGLLALALSFAPDDSFLGKQYDSSSSAPVLVSLLSETVPIIRRAVEPYYRILPPEKPDMEDNLRNGTVPRDII
ncbi:MAG: CvpA family protein [Candidatus Latescibacteria bacterium]|nr:CvpA family protein [Candidatus Latescibacterota bacterium]